MIHINKSIAFSILLITLFTATFNQVYGQDNPPIYPTSCPSHQTTTHSGSGPMPKFAPKEETLYSIRDKCLATSVRGREYIAQYYFLGSIDKDFTKLSLKSLMNIIDIMPSIYEAYDNFMDPKYTGEIVSEDMKDKLIDVLGAYRDLSENKEYKATIDNLIEDVTFVAKKKKSEVIEFMNK